MKIDSVIFDLDNTIYDEDTYFLEIFKQFSIKYNLNFNEIRKIFNETFRLNSNDIFGDMLKQLDFYSHERQEELFSLYKTLKVDLQLYPGALKIFNDLKRHNIKIGIITNGVPEAQKNKLQCLNIENLFDSVIIARQWGKEYEKPHKRPFLEALKELNTHPQNALYIGDSPYTDIEGAKKCNIHTALIKQGYMKNIEYNNAEFTITDIIELNHILNLRKTKK